MSASPPTSRSYGIRATVAILVLIGLAAAARRASVLIVPPSAPRFAAGAAMDKGFASHRLLTFAHIVPASFLFALMPLQFVQRIRLRYPDLHRWNGRLVMALGLMVATTALIMSATMSIGGVTEQTATTSFALLFLIFLGVGFQNIREGNVARHREWMIRAFGVSLGIATTRPIVGEFFAVGLWPPQEFFGIAFWLGFTLTLIGAEVYIRTQARFDIK